MRSSSITLAAAALLALALACKVSPPAQEIPLSAPSCPPGQTLVSDGSTWTCLDQQTIGFASLPHAEHTYDAGTAVRADYAANASTADLADHFAIAAAAFGSGTQGLDTLDVNGRISRRGLLPDAGVPGILSWVVSPPVATVGMSFSVPAGRFALIAQGRASSSDVYPAFDGCQVEIFQQDGGILAETTVYPFSMDGGVDVPQQWAISADVALPASDTLTLGVVPTGTNTCTGSGATTVTVEAL